MDILIKASGDLVKDKKFYAWLKSINSFSNRLFILCGGGSEITKILERNRIGFQFGPAGREIKSFTGKRLAKEVLIEQKETIEKELTKRKIKAPVLIPIITQKNYIFHLNGDKLAEALYPNFDKIIIVTTKGRVKNYPKTLQKIEVIHL